MKFCGSCGASLAPSNHDTLTPDQTSAESEAWHTNPGGELRFVTVLFADLAGSTAFAEDRAADEVARIVGDLLQRLGQVVEAHGGAVDKFLGDAVMATFGLPRPDPNAARHAVRAGLAMQNAMSEFTRGHDVDLYLRVGIHAGEVMFRALGANWTVMGDTVNTANRIQTATTPGKVWISRSVYDKVRRHFTLISRPAVELKGKRHSIQPYEVISERATPFVERPLFVGRDREWQALQTRLQAAIETRSLQILVIRGNAGVGKSRLVWELRDWLQRQEELYRVDVVQYDHSERLPAHGLNTLLRNRFNLALDLSDDQVLARLREQTAESESPLAAEFFAFLLGILRADFKIHAMDGRSRRDGAFAELRAWLEKRAAQTPWLLVLEDAQQGDETTAAFLEWLAWVEWNAPALALVTVREEDFDALSAWHAPLARMLAKGKAHELRLREIAAAELARALVTMGDGAVSVKTAQRIAEHTEGNPLFATELLLLLRESHELNDDAIWEQGALPGTIRQVMEARLERLGAEGKAVAKRGALMGRRFTREALERIWDRPFAELERGLEVLRETETIYEEASPFLSGEIEAVFRHSRFQEAARARIPRQEREHWLDGLDAWARGKLEGLGERWEAAGAMLLPLIVRACQTRGDLVQAGAWSELLGALHLKYFRLNEALEALQFAYEHAGGVRRVVLCEHVAQAQQFAGQAERALETLAQCAQLSAAPLDDLPEAVRRKLAALQMDAWVQPSAVNAPTAVLNAQLTRAEILSDLARTQEARAAFDEIERALSTRQDAAKRLWLRWGSLYSYFLLEVVGDPSGALQVYQTAQAHADWNDPAIEYERLQFLRAEGLIQARLGHFARTRELALERMRLARARGDLRTERDAMNALGLANFAQGRLCDSEADWQRSLEISRSIGYRRGEAIALHNLGETYRDQAQWERAERTQNEYWELSRRIGNHAAEGYARVALGQIAGDTGDYERALEWFDQARRVALQNGWKGIAADADAFTGVVELYRWLDERAPEALARAIQALSASEAGWSYQDDTGEIFATLVIACVLFGERAQAEQVLQRARARTGEAWLLSQRWLDAAEALVTGNAPDDVTRWFAEAGMARAALLLHRIARVTRDGIVPVTLRV